MSDCLCARWLRCVWPSRFDWGRVERIETNGRDGPTQRCSCSAAAVAGRRAGRLHATPNPCISACVLRACVSECSACAAGSALHCSRVESSRVESEWSAACPSFVSLCLSARLRLSLRLTLVLINRPRSFELNTPSFADRRPDEFDPINIRCGRGGRDKGKEGLSDKRACGGRPG